MSVELQRQQREIGVPDNDLMSMFLYPIKAEEARRQYTSKLKVFFDYAGLQGKLEAQAKQFVATAIKEPGWTIIHLLRFITLQKERVGKKEITEATLRNYYKLIRLFCEMNDTQFAWKR